MMLFLYIIICNNLSCHCQHKDFLLLFSIVFCPLVHRFLRLFLLNGYFVRGISYTIIYNNLSCHFRPGDFVKTLLFCLTVFLFSIFTLLNGQSVGVLLYIVYLLLQSDFSFIICCSCSSFTSVLITVPFHPYKHPSLLLRQKRFF